MSLKTNLNQLIKNRYPDVVTLNELEDYCHKARYKLSNAERTLRPSISPRIEGVYNEKGTAIVAYKWRQVNEKTTPIVKEIKNPDYLINTPCDFCRQYQR